MIPVAYPKPVVAIHQPNFLPWSGYFNKILDSDAFIFLDTAPFTKNGLQNRNRIRTKKDVQWLTVPVKQKGFYQASTNLMQISYQIDWRKKHLATLKQTYGKAAFFNEIYTILESAYACNYEFLADLNIQIIKQICIYLGINARFLLASQLNETGVATERILSLLKAVNAGTYLSGQSGKKYLDVELLARNKICLTYQSYQPKFDDIILNRSDDRLSVVDALFYLGPGLRNYLMEIEGMHE